MRRKEKGVITKSEWMAVMQEDILAFNAPVKPPDYMKTVEEIAEMRGTSWETTRVMINKLVRKGLWVKRRYNIVCNFTHKSVQSKIFYASKRLVDKYEKEGK